MSDSELKDRALDGLTKVLIAIFSFAALWLFSLEAVKQDLRKNTLIGDLVCWAALSDAIPRVINVNHWSEETESFPIIQDAVEAQEDDITELQVLQEGPDGDEDAKKRAQLLIFATLWPELDYSQLILKKTNMPFVYRIEGESLSLPLKDYLVFFSPPGQGTSDEDFGPGGSAENGWRDKYLKEYASIVQATDVSGQPWNDRGEIAATMRSQNAQTISVDKPRYWQTALALLYPGNRDPDAIRQISMQNKDFLSLIKANLPKERSILGVPVDGGLFLSGGGTVIFSLSLMLIGPIHAMKRCQTAKGSSISSNVVCLSGVSGRLWSFCLVVISLGMIALPIWVVVSSYTGCQQISLSVSLDRIRLISAIFTPVTCFLIALAIQEIRCYRENVAKLDSVANS